VKTWPVKSLVPRLKVSILDECNVCGLPKGWHKRGAGHVFEHVTSRKVQP
jgi:hypothetical protein